MENLYEKEPNEIVASMLESEPEILTQSDSLPSLKLDIDNGYFKLVWSADVVGKYDWIGLYANKDNDDANYIGGNNWQWAIRNNSYTTSTPVNHGYQARYLVWNYKTNKYESIVKTAVY